MFTTKSVSTINSQSTYKIKTNKKAIPRFTFLLSSAFLLHGFELMEFVQVDMEALSFELGLDFSKIKN